MAKWNPKSWPDDSELISQSDIATIMAKKPHISSFKTVDGRKFIELSDSSKIIGYIPYDDFFRTIRNG